MLMNRSFDKWSLLLIVELVLIGLGMWTGFAHNSGSVLSSPFILAITVAVLVAVMIMIWRVEDLPTIPFSAMIIWIFVVIVVLVGFHASPGAGRFLVIGKGSSKRIVHGGTFLIPYNKRIVSYPEFKTEKKVVIPLNRKEFEFGVTMELNKKEYRKMVEVLETKNEKTLLDQIDENIEKILYE